LTADAACLPTVVRLDPETQRMTSDVLFGGSPPRVLRLSPAGQRALAELEAGPVASAAAATLARRLTDANLAHPVLPSPPAPPASPGPVLDVTVLDVTVLDVTVLIPVRDLTPELRRCLAATGTAYPVLVVCFLVIFLRSMALTLLRRPVPWKGRPAATRPPR
jgi:hypothetical protein